jgi:hypothetical protein
VQALIDPANLQLTFRHCGYQLEGSGQRGMVGTAVSNFEQLWGSASVSVRPKRTGENHMSKKASEHHKKASEHLTHAARHHSEAAKHYDTGEHAMGAHHAHTARGHVVHARGHAEEAVKAHVEEHGKK